MIRKDGTIGGEYSFYCKIEPELKIIIDVGAQDSFFIGVDCEIHFFEPDTIAFNKLVYKITNNNIQNIKNHKNYFYNKVGLGKNTTKKKLYYESGSTNWRNVPITLANPDNFEEINIIRLDSYIEEKKIKEISLLKIDVEGMEYDVLLGIGNYINICKYIVFEYSWDTAEANGTNFSDIKNLLKNFELYRIENDGNLGTLYESKIIKRVLPNINNLVAIKL